MRSIVVTGAAQGIGWVIANRLSDCGYKVIGLDKDEEAIEERIGLMAEKNVEFKVADLARPEVVQNVCGEIVERKDEIMGLVNNAALSHFNNLQQLSLAQWNEVIQVNLTAPMLMVKYLSATLRAHKGAIVNICSTRALMSEPNTEAYSASKGGLLALTHSLAMSLSPDVRVNAVSPGWIETRGLQKSSNRQEVMHRQKDQQQHPAGRVGQAEDVADMVEYLLSEKAGFITGQNFIVDGGMTKKMIYEE